MFIDETTAKQVVKLMDFLVRYWSETESQIFEHAKDDDLCFKVINVLENNSLDTQIFLITQWMVQT